MRKINSIFRKTSLVLIILVLIAVSLTGVMVSAQSPAPSPTVSAAPSPSVVPSPSASITPAPSTPSATVSTAPIQPDWTPPPFSGATLPADLSGIAAQVLPSVASINVDISSTDFTGQQTIQQGAGSGWVIDSSGLIVTNNHVVENAQNISVSLSDGRNFPAQQVVADPISDLAVIKINATGLQAVTLGDSSKLKAGNMVIAIGNALGEGLTVTAGWVSRLGVSITVPGSNTAPAVTLFDLIEVSTPINPGNSGGPLIDSLGEVVGITNAKLVATGVEAVGYAISTKTAIPILQQLIQTGHVTRPYMGVSLQDVDPAIAAVYHLAVKQGALITQVDPSGPAATAGLQAGDVIVQMGSTTITSASDAVQAILTSQIGQQVTVTYYRGSNKSTASVTLAQNPTP